MAKHSMPKMKEGGVNVTPLIDVVMCLIIFFMLVAKIGVSTGSTPMELPSMILGRKIEDLGGSLIINVMDPNFDRDETTHAPKLDAQGRPLRLSTHFAEPRVTALVDPSEKDVREIKLTVSGGGGQVVDRPLQRVLTEALKKNKDFSVTIRAEKDLEFSMLQQVLIEIANAGIRNTNYGSKQAVK